MEKRFFLPVVLTCIVLAYFLLMILLYYLTPIQHEIQDFSVLIPGGTGSDFVWSMVIALSGEILAFLIAPYLSIFYLLIHRAVGLNRRFYFRARFSTTRLTGVAISLRSVTPGLVSISIGFLISSALGLDAYSRGLSGFIHVLSNGILFGIPLSSCLFAPLWCFEDYGICSSLALEKIPYRRTPELDCVGHWFYNLPMGLASIFIIVSFGILVISSLNLEFLNLFDAIFSLFSFVPLNLMLEVTRERRKEKFLNLMRTMGVDTEVYEIHIQRVTSVSSSPNQ